MYLGACRILGCLCGQHGVVLANFPLRLFRQLLETPHAQIADLGRHQANDAGVVRVEMDLIVFGSHQAVAHHGTHHRSGQQAVGRSQKMPQLVNQHLHAFRLVDRLGPLADQDVRV